MEKSKKNQRPKIGEPGYINQNCWLARSLDVPPYERCQYCELRFTGCTFLYYQLISFGLVIFFLVLSLLFSWETSRIVIIAVFASVIVYGYFFNKNTDKIVKTNFAQRKAAEALAELNKNLEKKVEEQTRELKMALESLKKLDEAKSEFISIASHQLRTPLTAIKGYISMILEGSYGKIVEKARTPMENVYKSNERLIDLVNNLLSISRIESGKMEFEPEEASIEEVIDGVVFDMKINAEKKELYLKWEKCEPALPRILLDKDKMRQVILNLVDNAIKYTKKGGITIKCQTSNDKLQIVISDTGGGMTKEELAKIFESFSFFSI